MRVPIIKGPNENDLVAPIVFANSEGIKYSEIKPFGDILYFLDFYQNYCYRFWSTRMKQVVFSFDPQWVVKYIQLGMNCFIGTFIFQEMVSHDDRLKGYSMFSIEPLQMDVITYVERTDGKYNSD